MEEVERAYKFPPFPSPPDGVVIVPFSAFRAEGYKRVTDSSGESIEVDAWAGIPTIKVLNEEEVAQQRKAKKKRRNAGHATDAEGRLIPWWEEWEADEVARGMSALLSGTSLEDRLCLAADDFRVGRTWPEIALGVRYMWDQFRLYIGLISSIPVYKRVKSRQKGQVDGPNNNAEEVSDEEEDVPRAKQTKVAIVQDHLEQRALPGKQLEPTLDSSTVEAQRLHAFLDDMEKSVKVFLSSYMRDTGLIWTEKNLVIAPTIIHFFLRFMLRNEVFAGSKDHLDNLKRALAVAAAARNELPLTAKLGQILPGQFDIACKECWGTKGSMTIHISTTLVPPEGGDNAPTSSQSDTSSAFETELKEHDIEIVPSDIVLDSITARQVMEDNLDTDHAVPVTTIPVAGDPWTAAVLAEDYTTASWTDVSVPWLMPLLGPTVFPLVMTTGVVEISTRRIREVIAPGERVDKTEALLTLTDRFYRVVMSPWVESAEEETAEFPCPVMVKEEDKWDPFQEDVTFLVDGDTAGQLVVGMGLCGTWVQMVPKQERDTKHPRECYWYMESLAASVPSYYTEGELMGKEELGDEGGDENV